MTRSGRPPLVVAHRGSSAAEPEHSLAAYERAMAEGADALEGDVRLTRDGHLVLIHDRRINRVADGRRVVSAARLHELAQHDFSRSRPDAGQRDERSTRAESGEFDARRSVLTLARLLEAVRGREVALSIETKHPTRYGGSVEQALVEMLTSAGWLRETPTDQLRVMSFSVLALRRFRRLAPNVPVVYLVEHLPPWRRDGSLPDGATIAGPSIEILRRDPAYVSRVHARGGDVHVWTVDTDADIDLCLALGVDAIISNRPGYVRERLS